MEKKLKKLFDYQHFENNARLAKLIGETESRYARELSDEDLNLVNAAGEFTMPGGTISGGGGGGEGAGGNGAAVKN